MYRDPRSLRLALGIAVGRTGCLFLDDTYKKHAIMRYTNFFRDSSNALRTYIQSN